MKTKMYGSRYAALVSFIAAVLLGAFFLSCANPVDSTGPVIPAEPEILFSAFNFDASEPVRGTPSAARDALAGTFSTANGTGNVSYELAEPQAASADPTHNHRFRVEGNKLFIEQATLDEGTYGIYARATDESGNTLEKGFTVEVFGKPGRPNGIIAVAGQRMLYLSWNRSGGATAYNVRYSTSSSGPYTEVPAEFTEEKGAITGLADTTLYYVQVRAKNSNGTGAWATVVEADTPTGDPIDAFWYTGDYTHLLNGKMYPEYKSVYDATEFNNRVGWDSMTDCYYFIPEDDGVRLVYGAPGVPIPMENSMIFYHKKFPAAEAEALAPGSMYCRGLSLYMHDNITRPVAGIFIYKHRFTSGGLSEGPREDPEYVYYSTYYWGLGAIQRQKTAFNDGIEIYGKYLIDMGNSAPVFKPDPSLNMPPNPEGVSFYSPTLAHAKANYTLAHMNYHIAWVSVPWYQRTLQYLGKNGLSNGDARFLGWLPNTPGPTYVMPE